METLKIIHDQEKKAWNSIVDIYQEKPSGSIVSSDRQFGKNQSLEQQQTTPKNIIKWRKSKRTDTLPPLICLLYWFSTQIIADHLPVQTGHCFFRDLFLHTFTSSGAFYYYVSPVFAQNTILFIPLWGWLACFGGKWSGRRDSMLNGVCKDGDQFCTVVENGWRGDPMLIAV